MDIEVSKRRVFGVVYVDVVGPDVDTVGLVATLVGAPTVTARQVAALVLLGHNVTVVEPARRSYDPDVRRPWTSADGAEVEAARERWRAAQTSRKGKGKWT